MRVLGCWTFDNDCFKLLTTCNQLDPKRWECKVGCGITITTWRPSSFCLLEVKASKTQMVSRFPLPDSSTFGTKTVATGLCPDCMFDCLCVLGLFFRLFYNRAYILLTYLLFQIYTSVSLLFIAQRLGIVDETELFSTSHNTKIRQISDLGENMHEKIKLLDQGLPTSWHPSLWFQHRFYSDPILPVRNEFFLGKVHGWETMWNITVHERLVLMALCP